MRRLSSVVLVIAFAITPAAQAARPSPEPPLTAGTSNFLVHYATTGVDAITAEQATAIGALLEQTRTFWIGQGYPAPEPDSGSDSRIDAYVDSTCLSGPGVNGTNYSATPVLGADLSGTSSYMCLRGTAPSWTPAHEAFHSIQRRIWRYTPEWIAEATAEWARIAVLGPDPGRDRLDGDSYQVDPTRPLDCAVEETQLSGICSYGRAPYFVSLANHHGNGLVLALLNELHARDIRDGSRAGSIGALEAVLAANGTTVADTFAEFTADALSALVAGGVPPATIMTLPVAAGYEAQAVLDVKRLAAGYSSFSLQPPYLCASRPGVTAEINVTGPAGIRAVVLRPSATGPVTVPLTAVEAGWTGTVDPFGAGTCEVLRVAVVNTTQSDATATVRVALRALAPVVGLKRIAAVRLPRFRPRPSARIVTTGGPGEGRLRIACGRRHYSLTVAVPSSERQVLPTRRPERCTIRLTALSVLGAAGATVSRSVTVKRTAMPQKPQGRDRGVRQAR